MRRQAAGRRAKTGAILAALALHVAILVALRPDAHPFAIPPDASPLTVELIPMSLADAGLPTAHKVAVQPAAAKAPHVVSTARTLAAAPVIAAPAPIVAAPKPEAPKPDSKSAPAPGPSATAPSTSAGSQVVAGGPAAAAAVGATLRESVGCDEEKFLSLSRAEREKCSQRFGRLAKDAPHVRALDLEQKAYFDGDCDPPDDEWCLYRRGRAPYPGLLSLWKKYHPHNDH